MIKSPTNNSCRAPLFIKGDPKIKETKWLVEASSLYGSGAVEQERTLPLLKKLQDHAASGVLFEEKLLEKHCYGGTCSAQLLNFVEQFTYSKETNLHQRVLNIAKQCVTSSVTLRTEQAALNAITKDSNNPCADFSKAKVQSIAALKDFKVDYASDSMPATKFGKIEFNDFVNTLEKLPEGVFFVRLLNSASNHKEESFGHSVLFLNFSEGHYFWDPMGGLTQLADFEVTKQLFGAIGGTSSRWGLADPRFYRIIKNDQLSQTTVFVQSILSSKKEITVNS